MEPNTGVVIVAGGRGRRMGTALPKQFLFLGERPLLAHTIDLFAGALPGAAIVVVLPEERIDYWRDLAARFEIAPHTLVAGGAERFHSVRNGLAALPADTALVLVHDAVRPLCSPGLIRRMAAAAAEHGAAIPVLPPVDSFRETEAAGGSHAVDRSRLRIVQTPQAFRAELLRRAYELPWSERFTDDASVVEQAGHPLFLCEGERTNLKITEPDDLTLAAAILEIRHFTDADTDNP